MAYVENPVVAGKDFESVMGDVNGNFNFLKEDIDNLKQKPFTKIGEYRIQTQVSWNSRYSGNSDDMAPDKLEYFYYKIDNGDLSLLDSGEITNSGRIATYENKILTKVPCDRVFYLIRCNVGRKNHIKIIPGAIDCTNVSNYYCQESPENLLGETNHASSEIYTDYASVSDYQKYYCYKTSYNQSSIIIKQSILQKMDSKYKKDGYKIIGFEEQDSTLTITVQGNLMDKDNSAQWEKNSEGEPLYVEMYDYSKLHPEEFASTIDISVYTLEPDLDIVGIDWDNPWTET